MYDNYNSLYTCLINKCCLLKIEMFSIPTNFLRLSDDAIIKHCTAQFLVFQKTDLNLCTVHLIQQYNVWFCMRTHTKYDFVPFLRENGKIVNCA